MVYSKVALSLAEQTMTHPELCMGYLEPRVGTF